MGLYTYSHHYHPYHHHITQRVDNNKPDASKTTQNDDDEWGRCQPATSMLETQMPSRASGTFYFGIFRVFFLY